MSRRTVAAVSLLASSLAVVLFAGCASAAPGSAASTAAPEEPAASALELDVQAGWLDGGRLVSLVTQGSSSCVPVADAATLGADGSIAVTLSSPEGVCTADFAPRVSLVAPPEGVAPGAALSLVVTLDGVRGEVSLGAYAGDAVAEYTPSAGWVDDHTFALLTWGSSSCAPVVESVSVVSSSEVSVVFADLGDRPCTMDLAPRVALVSVDGAAEVPAEGAVAVLSGGGPEFAEPVRVPIS